MQGMKKILVSFIIMSVVMLFFPVCADAAEKGFDEELYRDQLIVSGADGLDSYLPEETRELLSESGFSLDDPYSMTSPDSGRILTGISDILMQKQRTAFPVVCTVIGIMLLCSFSSGFEISMRENALSRTISLVSTLGICAAVILPLCRLTERAGEVVQGAAGFMAMYVPVMSGLMISSAQEIQGSSYYVLLMGAAQVTGLLSSKIIFPLIKIFLSLSVVSSLSPYMYLSSLINSIYNGMKWMMNLSVGIFSAILSAQTVIASSMDNVSSRAVRFAVSSFVPVVGGVLGETLNTFSGSLTLLKSGTGVFALIAGFCIFIPVMIECIIWRLSFFLLGAASDILGISSVKALLKTVENVTGLIIAVMMTVIILFIISTVLVLIVGK